MSFLDAVKRVSQRGITGVKKFFGVGGVRLEIRLPQTVEKASGVVMGQLRLSARNEQTVKKIEVKLVEKWSMGGGEDRREKEYDLGKVFLINEPFTLTAGESRVFDFAVPAKLVDSRPEDMDEMEPAEDGEEHKEKFEYRIQVLVDVKGAVLGPLRKMPVVFT